MQASARPEVIELLLNAVYLSRSYVAINYLSCKMCLCGSKFVCTAHTWPATLQQFRLVGLVSSFTDFYVSMQLVLAAMHGGVHCGIYNAILGALCVALLIWKQQSAHTQ